MAYTPINWQTGDTITADKLNRCDNGWRVESTQLFSETVTTEAGEYGNEGMLTYSSQVSSPTITVTFDGTNYQCSVVKMGEGYGYGGVSSGWEYDFTTYPFAFVFSNGDGNVLATQTAGTYAVAVSTQDVEVSDNFIDAVNAIADTSAIPMQCLASSTTYAEMRAARDARRLMYAYLSSKNCVLINSVPDDASGNVGYYPQSTGLSLGFDNDGILQAIQ